MSLTLENVTYRYAGGAAPVLHGVDLTVERGRIVGLVGRNGAGKSTMCICAVGLAPRSIGGELTGRVTVDEIDTRNATASELAQHAGILFQETHTQLSGAAPTVWEEIAFGPRNLSLPLSDVIGRTEEAIDALGIGSIVERDPQRLSGGQAQLVALAAVLALRPAYLVLDEPTSQLDPLGTNLVGDALVRAAAATGAGILIVEHKTDLIERLCREVAVIEDGRIVASGPASDVLRNSDLSSWGVAPPSEVRLQNAVVSAGLTWQQDWA